MANDRTDLKMSVTCSSAIGLHQFPTETSSVGNFDCKRNVLILSHEMRGQKNSALRKLPLDDTDILSIVSQYSRYDLMLVGVLEAGKETAKNQGGLFPESR